MKLCTNPHCGLTIKFRYRLNSYILFFLFSDADSLDNINNSSVFLPLGMFCVLIYRKYDNLLIGKVIYFVAKLFYLKKKLKAKAEISIITSRNT